MVEDIEHVKRMISDALGDALRRPDGGLYAIDMEAVKREIVQFVLPDKISSDESRRYELYYLLLGKAVAIAQGWKINHAEEIHSPEQAVPSLKKYIEQTYGSKG